MNHLTEHLPYLRACAAAIKAAGIGVTEVVADATNPRNGYIGIGPDSTSSRFGEATLALYWNEETGWYRGVELPDEHGQLSQVCDSDLDLLTAPTEVAAWCGRVLDGTATNRIYEGQPFRYFDDEDDFDARLREYWPAATTGGES